MELDIAQERQQAHLLLDAVPDSKISVVRSLLEVIVEPLAHSLAEAEVESEELTPEALAALRRARASLAKSEGVTHDEILREFGT